LDGILGSLTEIGVSDLKRSAITFKGKKKNKKKHSKLLTNIHVFLVWETHFVVSKIVTFQKLIQPRKQLVVVEGIDGFYIAGAVV